MVYLFVKLTQVLYDVVFVLPAAPSTIFEAVCQRSPGAHSHCKP